MKKFRLFLLTLLVAAIFLFSVIFVRLAYIQVVWGKDLQQKASDQWQRDLPIKAYRGDIVDTNGSLLATTQTSYGLYARPQSVTDAELCAKTLADILQKEIVTAVQGKAGGVIESEENPVLENLKIPATIVYPGHASNKQEYSYMEQPSYQEKIATAVWNGVSKAYEMIEAQ
jgi:cell division protein FtsI/penicillin-binding protein 2